MYLLKLTKGKLVKLIITRITLFPLWITNALITNISFLLILFYKNEFFQKILNLDLS